MYLEGRGAGPIQSDDGGAFLVDRGDDDGSQKIHVGKGGHSRARGDDADGVAPQLHVHVGVCDSRREHDHAYLRVHDDVHGHARILHVNVQEEVHDDRDNADDTQAVLRP
jgi:hypothetical protein